MFSQSQRIRHQPIRHRSHLERMLIGAVVLMLVVVGSFLLPAKGASAAQDEALFVATYTDEDGVVYELYRWNDETFEWLIYPDGTIIIIDWGNPNPEDGTDEGKDLETILALLKQHGGPANPVVDFLGTPLGVALVEGGKTIIPIHNPAELADLFEDAGGFGGNAGGFDPMGGSIQEQLKKAARGGDGDGDDGDGDEPPTGAGFWNDLPGPPDLVNPAPVSR